MWLDSSVVLQFLPWRKQRKWSKYICLAFFKKYLLLFNYSYLHFLPIPPPHPSQTPLLPPPLPSPLILFMCPFFFLYFTEFIGVILVHKTIQVSSAQLNKTSSAHCIVLPSPKAKELPIHPSFAYLHLPATPSLTGYYHTVVCEYVCVYNVFCFIFHIP